LGVHALCYSLPMRVEPATARYQIESAESSLRITIPARFHALMVMVWLVWLVLILGAGAKSLIPDLVARPDGFISLTFLVWAGLVSTGVLSMLWSLLGREVITIRENVLECRMCLGPLGYSRTYTFADAHSFRICLKATAFGVNYKHANLPVGRFRGTILFEYHGRTKYLGACLDETETNHIFAVMKPLIDARPRRERKPA
jgi:hypothetical protein